MVETTLSAAEEIKREIEEKNVLPPGTSAEDAVGAVMCVLAQRLPGGEARDVAEAMPYPLNNLVHPCANHPERPSELFDAGGFVDRVGLHLGVEVVAAERIVKAVFAVMKNKLGPKESSDVLGQLPRGLAAWWGAPDPMATKRSVTWLSRPDAVSGELVRKVREEGVVPPGIVTADAIAAVICVLTQRLSGGEARKLFEAMPPTFRNMLRPCALHGEQPEEFQREEFLHRVAGHLKIGPEAATEIVRAVFAAVKSHLPKEEVAGVAGHLPGDLAEIWSGSRLAGPEAGPLRVDAASMAMIAEIEERGVLPAEVKGADAITAVMCLVNWRISGGEARDVVSSMPVYLRSLMLDCGFHPEEADVFGRGEFIGRVSGQLGVDAGTAEEIAKAVFAAVRKQMPAEEIDHILSQLPQDLKELWRAPVSA
jgi:uncharacterized protein (DUF2267 family)